MDLLRKLFRLPVKKLFKGQEAVIELAFNVGGKDYYRFADINQTSYKRGLMAVAIYNELDMRCSRDYLELHVKAVDDILKSKEIDIYRLNTLNNQMKTRLGLKTDVDLMYKLASVAYFDKNENPDSYDFAYNERKIAHWKKHAGVADFFLSQPLMDLIPYCRNADIDLNSFSTLNEELNAIHLDILRLNSSKKQ